MELVFLAKQPSGLDDSINFCDGYFHSQRIKKNLLMLHFLKSNKIVEKYVGDKRE